MESNFHELEAVASGMSAKFSAFSCKAFSSVQTESSFFLKFFPPSFISFLIDLSSCKIIIPSCSGVGFSFTGWLLVTLPSSISWWSVNIYQSCSLKFLQQLLQYNSGFET
ncbi:unnamed protein product [Clavelina lepadiformis]|uniref:Uncharacterized protein n=1 Tax=Clavelina lepadiformis TaxID=159417 RepID=A0ABP0F2D7_CLALP